jgi:diguanylate cyclase (GGDEF)-like protein/PAS domain S-box-containing protein
MGTKPGKTENIEIVIAEDSPTQAEQLRYLLEEHGYAVVAAPDGRQALASIRQRKPALVISDVVMPELDGYGLCKAIKSDPQLKGIPVILVTTLSDPQDVIRGLECGADNFIRKPYEERYLLSRVEYLLMNLELRQNHKMQMALEINLGGQRHIITAERQQILDLLISTYEQAVHLNDALTVRERELAHSNQVLHGLYRIAEGLNQVSGESAVADTALERALELPGIQAGWISLREGESGFRLAAARNLPPALSAPGALEGDCTCRRNLLGGALDGVTNILECERLGKAQGDTQGLHYHASVPLWLDDRILGVMNLVGPGEGLFDEEALKMLYGIGNQVAVALERARLHEHLEQLVAARTASLAAEVAQRKRIQEEQARLVAIIEATPDFVGTAHLDGAPIFLNGAALRILGFEPGQDISIVGIAEIYPEWAAKQVLEQAIPHAVEHETWSGETAFRRRDGREIPVSQVIIAHRGPDGAVAYLSSIARDISERKEQEARIMRLNRIYAVLSGINTTIVRVRDEGELFREACRIAVEHGKFTFAWLGKLDAATQQVTPVAQAGRDEGYLSQVNLTAKEDVAGNCKLIAQALTQAQPVVCNDVASDERMAAWRDDALSRGYRSVAVFPLLVEELAVGVLVLYAPEPDVFDNEEMGLLIEMAGDISFAMNNFKKEEKLDYLAYYDVITGLPNRTLFYDRIGQHLLDTTAGEIVAVLAIDLERFRVINETFGRHVGDALLKQVAERLTDTGVGVDHLARISSDCFAVVLSDVRVESDVVRFVEMQITRALSKPITLEGQELRISARVGIALFPNDGKDADILFQNAEAALKKAKVSGDKYLFYAPEFNARVAEKLKTENKLRTALEQNQLVLYYQPKVDLGSGRISGLEALMRWNDPETGLVPPWKFIPLLEETGMIVEAGSWALEQAMTDYRELQKNHLSPPRIAVNVSQVQLQRNDFVSMMERVVSGFGGASDALAIEITESMVMQDIEANIQKLRAIRGMGVEVAIDDFGTGYSSLSYIAKLPISSLKIDRSFIVDMASNADDLSIVSVIISLAHSLNLRVIAEGVESNEQAKLLRLLKCDEFQGYLFSPAVPLEQIEVLFKEKRVFSE